MLALAKNHSLSPRAPAAPAIYYTYCLLDPTKPGIFKYGNLKLNFEPFYVGKGKGKRALNHFAETSFTRITNKHKTNKIRKLIREGYEIPIHIISNCLKEKTAFHLECKYIDLIGRRNTHTGNLLNLTDGGEGGSGKVVTAQMRKNMSEGLKNMPEATRLGRNAKISAANTIARSLETTAQKIERSVKRSEGLKKAWAQKTEKEKSSINNKRSESHKSYRSSETEEQRLERSRKISQTLKRKHAELMASITPAELEERKRKKSEACKKSHARRAALGIVGYKKKVISS